MTARTIVGALGLLALLGVTVYLLFQIPAAYAIGGIVALAAILWAVGRSRPTSPSRPVAARRSGSAPTRTRYLRGSRRPRRARRRATRPRKR